MKTFDDSTLLPCPFCGGKGETLIDVAAETAYARCTNGKCCAYTSRARDGSREHAAKRWNRRIDSGYRRLAQELAEAGVLMRDRLALQKNIAAKEFNVALLKYRVALEEGK